MSITVSKVGRQKTIAGLARALFEVKGDPALQAQAEEALLRVNPGLADGLRPGTPILVPPIGFPGAPRERRLPAEATALVRRAAALLAAQAGAPLDAALKAAAEEAKALRRKPVIDAIVEARPDLKDGLPELAVAAEEEVKRATESAAILRAAISRLGSILPEDGKS